MENDFHAVQYTISFKCMRDGCLCFLLIYKRWGNGWVLVRDCVENGWAYLNFISMCRNIIVVNPMFIVWGVAGG